MKKSTKLLTDIEDKIRRNGEKNIAPKHTDIENAHIQKFYLKDVNGNTQIGT